MEDGFVGRIRSNYAYHLNAVDQNSGGEFTFSVCPAYDYINGNGMQVPHFRYFTPTEFDVYTSLLGNSNPQGDPYFHELVMDWELEMLNDPLKIFMFAHSGTAIYRDNNGSIINSNDIYAIRKGRGIWYNNFNAEENVVHNRCGLHSSFNSVKDHMNSNNAGNGQPPLMCASNLGVGPFNLDGTSTPEGGELNCGTYHMADEVTTYTTTTHHHGWDTHVYYTSSSLITWTEINFDCNLDASGGTPPGYNGGSNSTEGFNFGDFLVSCEAFGITSFTKGQKKILYKTGPQFLDNQGYPKTPTLNLAPGLYRFTVKRPGKLVSYAYVELGEAISISVQHKDFFEATIFPNPNTEGFYFINISTSARLRPLYEVYDATGNILWRQNFDLSLGHQETHRIAPDSYLPNGILLHKFTFEDGSYETITTIKQ